MGDFKGGRISIEIGGKVFSARASAKVEPAGVMVTSEANQDGSAHNYVTAKLISFDVLYDRGDPSQVKWDTAMLLTSVNASFVETDARVQHLLTGGFFNGTPTIDTEKGEVSGLQIKGPSSSYQQLAV